MKAVLIATIGTRDLMFQTQSEDWFNIGDDQMRGDIIGEQAEVLEDLGQDLITFRELTQFLLDHLDQYRSRIRPIIMGKLFQERAADISKIYLVGTDQPSTVAERNKDTLNACYLLQDWFQQHYSHITVELIALGADGTNPSDFEAMFRWWQKVWRETIQVSTQQPIWLCIKGGVGQTAEAARISGLSLYSDRIQFFDFKQTPYQNRQGIPSAYSGPFKGTSYLWDRTRQQALRLWERYDYAGLEALLAPYFQQDQARFGALPIWIKAGVDWNQGEFKTFFQRVKSTLPPAQQRQGHTWWWMAYEQAQLAQVRLHQQHTSEAMLHSFRAVEGVIWEWMLAHYGDYIQHPPRRYPQLLGSICDRYPSLRPSFVDRATGQLRESANLNGYIQQALLEAVIPAIISNTDFQSFWSQDNRDQRNTLSHRLGGLTARDLFLAWGADTQNAEDWQKRIINCLNLIASQSFRSLDQASIFSFLHKKIQKLIDTYEP
ncbi:MULTISPECIES: hypothetical protein [Cyanophyceae]|uniref:hypothetical protein n=1 Tax=Cyanophyceae TaxID=3028117 RepID=UPI0016867BCB|nr:MULTISPECIES: hypothetical protein [Cyanophyceae]MBD1914280.1 hypothetical protein [Phormidium sp. FACHB-77]MBD2031215.1 hypothetical protein [Phormidium sp. FACHB-322]MBD2049614.1 hypothetical protein [Leptolyngbya sp. FACHB-60]